MPQNQSALDFEKLREFELRMHYEGVSAFAAGPSPWESWDDAGAMGTWQRLEDTPLHPARRPSQPGMGQRLLHGLTRLLILMLLVGIGGVYLSTVSEAPVVATGISPAPIVVARTVIPATPPADTLADELGALPAPAAGDNLWSETEVVSAPPPAADTAIDIQNLASIPADPAQTDPAQDDVSPWASQDALESTEIPAPEQSLPEIPAPAPAGQVAMLDEPVPPPAPMEAASAALDAAPPPAQEHHPPEGEWVVNLASYNRESMAQRMLAKFKDKGVAAEIVTITVNDKPVVRIRTTGYQSAGEARDWVALLEERLGLEGVWISKR